MAHGHSHESACCHDHDHDSEDPAVLFTLYQKVTMVALRLPFQYNWCEWIYILLGPDIDQYLVKLRKCMPSLHHSLVAFLHKETARCGVSPTFDVLVMWVELYLVKDVWLN